MRRPGWTLRQVWQLVSTHWLMLGVVAVAVVLRNYSLDVTAWVPDSYDRLFEARALLDGRLPESAIYPPGMSVFVAPFFVVLPDTLWTMQMVIACSGVLLVVVVHRWVLSLVDDQLAAGLAAVAAAAAPQFVFASRDNLLDVPTLLLMLVALWLAPKLRSMPVSALALYGLLLAELVNLRPNNVVVLPAIGLLYLSAFRIRRLPDAATSLVSAPVLVSGTVFLAVCAGSVIVGEWANASASVPMTVEPALQNLAYYVYVLSDRMVGLFFVLPLATAGGHALWRSKPWHATAFFYLILVWPVLYAPFDFTSTRYMLPPLLLTLCLASIGAASLLRGDRGGRALSDWGARYAAAATAVVGLTFAAGSTLVVTGWPVTVAESDEGLAAELRPAVAALEEDSLLVSAVTRAFLDSSPNLGYFDLIDATLSSGSGEEGVPQMLAAIDEQIESGGRVYYLFSHWEQGSDFTGTGEEGYDSYWEAINLKYRIAPIVEGTQERLTGETWTLYEVGLK